MATSAPDIPTTMGEWVQGWTRSRGTPPPQVTKFGLSVQVHGYGESVRRVLLDPTPELLAMAIAQATEPRACIKFAGDPALWLAHFPAGWQPQDEQWLMTAPLPDPVPAVSPHRTTASPPPRHPAG